MIIDLNNMDDNSVVLFHACGHNPTGYDPSKKLWSQIAEIC